MLLGRSVLLPKISSIQPISFEPGASVVIRGQGFGEKRGTRGVELDGSPLTAASYLSWSDERIEVVIPFTVDSGILRVFGSLGSSNAEIIVSRRETPQPPSGDAPVPVRPAISSIEPEEARVGDLIAIKGIGFGNNLQFSSVRFSLNTAAFASNSSAPGTGTLSEAPKWDYAEPKANQSMYEAWDDKEISVRVPEGAGSGTIVVRTPQGESPPFSFKVSPGSGKKYIYETAVYTIEFGIDIQNERLNQGGSILLYLPEPVSSSSQSLDSIQDEGMAPLPGTQAGIAVYKIEGEGSGEERVRRTARLTVNTVETDLASYKDGFKAGQTPDFLTPYIAEEPDIPAGAKEIVSLSSRVVGKETNPQRKAALLWSWMKKSLVWDGGLSGANRSAISALRNGRTDARHYVLLACALFRASRVPAVPISGLLAMKDGATLPHTWMEYYLPALGWVPFDPVLATGAKPGGFDAGFEEAGRYFGSIDNRHIAITRGSLRIQPSLQGSKLKDKGPAWSLQTLYEESSGASYSSVWASPRLTGEY
ncbi:MAG: IPT/TIG domain-containing protein [Spirochaetes bacterium]|nr:IPT/TIG domain-containing protein [Spirochaetota bacterium]